MSLRLIIFNFFAILAYARSLEEAKDGMYPYQVSIQHVMDRGKMHFATGAIVHKEWVVTVAQAFYKAYPNYTSYIVVGSNSIISEPGVRYPVLEVYSYPENEKYQDNVAILKVAPIEFDAKVSKIKINTEYVGADVSVILTGWSFGFLDPSTSLTQAKDKLRELQSTTMTNKDCENQVRPTKKLSWDTKICTAVKEGEDISDYGGLLVQRKEDKLVLIGLLGDYGGRTEGKKIPNIYSRLSSNYVKWFNEKCNNCLKN